MKPPVISESYHMKPVYAISWGPKCHVSDDDISDASTSWLYTCGGEGVIMMHPPDLVRSCIVFYFRFSLFYRFNGYILLMCASHYVLNFMRSLLGFCFFAFVFAKVLELIFILDYGIRIKYRSLFNITRS